MVVRRPTIRVGRRVSGHRAEDGAVLHGLVANLARQFLVTSMPGGSNVHLHGHRRNSVGVRLWIVSAVLLSGVMACSSSAEPRALYAPVPIGLEARKLAVPFDRYNFSPKDLSLLKGAEDVLVHDCMRARSMKWQMLPPAVEDEIEPAHRRRYGVIEPEVARLFGYHLAPQLPSVARRGAAQQLRMERLSATERQAAYGKADGCLKQANDRIQRGVPPVDAKLFNKLIFDTFAQSKRDSQVVRAFRVWSTCMRDDGLHYADPLAAASDQRWDDDEPTQEERRTAQTDMRCKAKSDMISVWSAAEKRLQDAAIRAHPAQFRALQAAKDQQLVTARRILADQN